MATLFSPGRGQSLLTGLSMTFTTWSFLTFPAFSSTCLAVCCISATRSASSWDYCWQRALFIIALARGNSLMQGHATPHSQNYFHPITGPHKRAKTWSHYLNSEPLWGPSRFQSASCFWLSSLLTLVSQPNLSLCSILFCSLPAHSLIKSTL